MRRGRPYGLETPFVRRVILCPYRPRWQPRGEVGRVRQVVRVETVGRIESVGRPPLYPLLADREVERLEQEPGDTYLRLPNC